VSNAQAKKLLKIASKTSSPGLRILALSMAADRLEEDRLQGGLIPRRQGKFYYSPTTIEILRQLNPTDPDEEN
jgi:hypothetical protein